MVEILQFYVSGFWVWAGITIAGAFLIRAAIMLIAVTIAAVKGDKITLNLFNEE